MESRTRMTISMHRSATWENFLRFNNTTYPTSNSNTYSKRYDNFNEVVGIIKENDKMNTQTYNNIGVYKATVGKYFEAIEDFNSAIKIDQNYNVAKKKNRSSTIETIMKNPELKIFYNAKYSITTPSLIPRQSYWFDKAYNQLTTINQSKDMLIQSENSFF